MYCCGVDQNEDDHLEVVYLEILPHEVDLFGIHNYLEKIHFDLFFRKPLFKISLLGKKIFYSSVK